MSATWVVLCTVRRTLAVTAAVLHTLYSPLCTDVVGQCEAVFGNVRGYAVLADAGVREESGVAVVLAGF